MKKIMRASALLLGLAVASCVTINIYFPAEEIRGAADKIVNEVWGERLQNGTEDAAPQPEETSPGSNLWRLISPVSAVAAQDIDVSTPTIRAIKEAMKERSAALIDYLKSGHLGLGHDGLLKVRTTEGLSLQQKGELNRLLAAENQDRLRLYREIAVANGFPDKVEEVQSIFAESWRKQAQKGWYLETAEGRWQQK